MKKTLIAFVVILLIGFGIYFFTKDNSGGLEDTNKNADLNIPQTDRAKGDVAPLSMNGPEVLVGKSVSGRDITAYNFGTGEKNVLFVAGVHGGYSWNTTLLAYELIDYLKSNPEIVPSNVKVTIIPVVNPDGLNLVTGKDGRFTESDVTSSESTKVAGRFNANNVDLNRNFDCDWQSSGVWQSKTVSGGESVFSEPESLAIKNYIEKINPKAVVVWYGAAGGVYASSCGDSILPETDKLTNLFATASGYKPYKDFNSYNLTGDMVNWLAKKKVPAISVLLTNHKDIELEKNKAGFKAVLEYYK